MVIKNKLAFSIAILSFLNFNQAFSAVYEARFKLDISSFNTPEEIKPPEISSFAINPLIISQGQEAILNWSGKNIKFVTISGNGIPAGNITSQNIKFVPLSSGNLQYTLNAFNTKNESVSEIRILEVVPNPTITSFNVDKTSILEGESVSFNWTGDAAEFKFNNNVVTSNTLTITPENVGINNYTLSAYNKLGSEIVMNREVNVSPALVPLINTFTVSKNEIEVGNSVTFNWTGNNVARYSIYNNNVLAEDNLSGNSLTLVPVLGLNSYELRGYNTKGDIVSAPYKRNIRVTEIPKIISYYPSVGKTVINGESVYAITEGSEVTLSYQIENYSIIKINGNVTYNYFNYNVTPISSSDYTLELTGYSGTIVSKPIHIEVVPKPEILSFTTDKTTYKNGEPIIFTWNTRNADNTKTLVNYGYVSGNTTSIIARLDRPNQKYDIIVSNVLGYQVNSSVTVNVIP